MGPVRDNTFVSDLGKVVEGETAKISDDTILGPNILEDKVFKQEQGKPERAESTRNHIKLGRGGGRIQVRYEYRMGQSWLGRRMCERDILGVLLARP